MEVQFAKSFFKSLKNLNSYHNPLNKTYRFFRYGIPTFFKNIWIFRKALWEWQYWDYQFTLHLLKISIEKSADGIEKYGNEVEESKNKKIAKMRRAVVILNNFAQQNFIDHAEKELGDVIHREMSFKEIRSDSEAYEIAGERNLFDEVGDDNKLYEWINNNTPEENEHNSKIYDRSDEIEKLQWNELWNIFKGQNYSDFVSTDEDYEKWFDGSGMNSWWD